MNKGEALLLITLLAVLSLIMVESASAQSIPVPSTPTFTIKFIDNSYTKHLPTITSTDPYTGKTTINKTGGQYVKKYTIEIIINNQELPSTLNSNKYSVYYSIRQKPHSVENWIFGQYGELLPCNNSLSPDPSEANITEYFQKLYQTLPDSLHTIFQIDGSDLNQDDQIDFQVKAVIGHTFNLWTENYVVDHYSYGIPRYGNAKVLVPVPSIAEDSEGNWSTTQTLTIPETTSTTSPEPQQPEPFPTALVIVASVILVVLVGMGLLVYFEQHKHQVEPGHFAF